jgi:hypothetical protein
VDNNRIFFYSSFTRAAAIGQLTFDNYHVTVGGYPDGAFGSWTHIVSIYDGRMLFYNSANGAGGTGRLTNAHQFINLTGYAPGSFGRDQSHIVPTYDGRLLWYTTWTGSGAVGRLDGGNHVTVMYYPPGSFATGWNLLAAA